MKGLLIKDFNLFKGQRKFFLVVVVLAVFMAFATNDTSYIVSYVTLILPLFSLSTISYDDYDNGNAFLFTLPISRVKYVLEKYCFMLLLGLGSIAISLLLSLIVGAVIGTASLLKIIMSVPAIFAIMLVIQAIMIPVQLKFGSEKGRIAIFAIVGVIFVACFGVVKFFELLEIDITSALNIINSLSFETVITIAILFVIAILLLSVKISISVVKKKEY